MWSLCFEYWNVSDENSNEHLRIDQCEDIHIQKHLT